MRVLQVQMYMYMYINVVMYAHAHNIIGIVSTFFNVLYTGPLRLTFPVRGGVILEPFQLEHGKVVSHKVFILKESFHKMLVNR